MQPAHPGLRQGLDQDLLADALQLNVHLEGVDSLGGARHLEVHIPQGVLYSLNVAEDGETPIFPGHQPHGDAGHRFFEGHSGVHQGQGAAADTAHGGAAVGAKDLGHHPDDVGEFVLRGQHRQKGPLRQRPVADLPAARRADPAGFSGGEGWEVVVVHEQLGILEPHGIQLLFHPQGGQGGDGQHLGKAAGKEAGTVGTGQNAHLAGHGPDCGQRATVGADALLQDAAAHLPFQQALKG